MYKRQSETIASQCEASVTFSLILVLLIPILLFVRRIRSFPASICVGSCNGMTISVAGHSTFCLLESFYFFTKYVESRVANGT